MPPRGKTETSRTDGRTLRSERSRERIAQAIYELVREHGRQPTALEIARRAGVGLRTLFRHLGQMESLHAAVSQRMLEQVRGHTRLALEGTQEERVAALVRQRMRLFEEVAPFERVASAAGGTTAGQQPARAAILALLRDQIVRVLEPADRDALEALDAILSIAHWDRLAHVQGLGRTRVARILEAEVRALLPGRRGD